MGRLSAARPSGSAVRCSPFYVTEGEPYRPEMIVWMDLPSGLVVGHHLQDPQEPVEFGATLTDAMERPLVGSPRRPARIRVANSGLAESVRRAVVSDVEIVVAPTPELDEVLEAMKHAPPTDDAPDESYLEEAASRPRPSPTCFVPRSVSIGWRLGRRWTSSSSFASTRLDSA